MRARRSLFALLATSWLACALDAQDMERARTLFVTNCAACHGESGDGKGTTELDRPARSFQDGGFSFGNTPEALFKTISTGIPGSPMAGFDGSLTEEERHLVAAYVVTLGPPITEVAEADMILTVKDKPLIVRGLLPSLGEGLPQTPRGLLIGDPSGITFEYRVDDVRLLALRQGGFVKRTDWTGRGGTELEPLGKVVQLVEGGKPESSFWSGGKPLATRFSGTKLTKGAPGSGAVAATLDYHLVADSRELTHVVEFPWVFTTPLGTGYQRDLFFESGGRSTSFAYRTPGIEGAQTLARGDSEGERWIVVRPAGGAPSFIGLESAVSKEIAAGALEASVRVDGHNKVGLSVVTVSLIDWNDRIAKELARWWENR